jgi:hypothetical protein
VMSKNAAEQCCLFSRASFIFCTIRCVYSIVECLCQKPNWWLGISLSISIIGRSLVKSRFSKILDAIGRRLIGR